MERQCQNLLNLICSVLTDRAAEVEDINLSSLLSLAQAHGVTNLLYPAFRKLPIELRPAEAAMHMCKQITYAAATRHAVQENELSTVLRSFHEAQIEVLPLKGCVIKKLYPLPEYRYMSDVDLLFPATEAKKVQCILERMGFTTVRFAMGETDLYISPLGMNYELHRSLQEEGSSQTAKMFLSRLLDVAVPSARGDSLQLPPEEHYIYILLHIVKHLSSGGAGLRSVMDVWACKTGWNFNREKLAALLAENELTAFAQTIEKLADVWFMGAPEDPLACELGEYLIAGALFGTEERRVASRMLRQPSDGGKNAYWRRRIFPAYSTMCSYFPVVKKCPIVLPFAWLYRVFRGIFGKRKKLAKEQELVEATDQTILQERRSLFLRCGLRIEQEERR